tara:strand:+ start:342 stop:743 length:402 start_codon:yes stop_codon:yes gene_type:complete
MKSFTHYKKQRGGKKKSKRRQSRRPVSLHTARDILRQYYLNKNKRNKKKAQRGLRKDIASKVKSKRTLRSKSKRSYLYRPRKGVKGPTGPGLYDMAGLDNKHRQFKKKRSYRKYKPYSKKTTVKKFLKNIFEL